MTIRENDVGDDDNVGEMNDDNVGEMNVDK